MTKPTFSDLIVSLAQTAYVYLGVIEDPFSKNKSLDLKQAKYTIDLLELIESKTKGNLTREESDLLRELLYDLRMQYLYKLDKK